MVSALVRRSAFMCFMAFSLEDRYSCDALEASLIILEPLVIILDPFVIIL